MSQIPCRGCGWDDIVLHNPDRLWTGYCDRCWKVLQGRDDRDWLPGMEAEDEEEEDVYLPAAYIEQRDHTQFECCSHHLMGYCYHPDQIRPLDLVLRMANGTHYDHLEL